MMRPLVAGTVIAFLLAPAVSWSKDPLQQIGVFQKPAGAGGS
jgi:hypothetical protein